MRSTWPAVAALVVGPALLPALALAQGTTPTPTTAGAGALRITYLRVGDETVSSISPRPLGIKDCTPPTAILTFEVDNIPDGKRSLDVYFGSGCNATDRDSTTTPKCTFVQMTEVTSQQDLEVTVDAANLECGGGDRTLWFLAVDSSQASEDVGTGYGSVVVPIDTAPPAAPSNVEGGAGEKQIPVSWDIGTGDPEKFIVYIDDQATEGGEGADGGTSSDGKCSSSRLIAGSAARDIPKSVPTKVIEERTATGIDLDSKDIRGDFAAVGVVAVDIAGNESALSELACVEVVPTEGFWERYEKQGGTADTGCAVHATPVGTSRDGAPAALVATLGLLAVVRMRRRRS